MFGLGLGGKQKDPFKRLSSSISVHPKPQTTLVALVDDQGGTFHVREVTSLFHRASPQCRAVARITI